MKKLLFSITTLVIVLVLTSAAFVDSEKDTPFGISHDHECDYHDGEQKYMDGYDKLNTQTYTCIVCGGSGRLRCYGLCNGTGWVQYLYNAPAQMCTICSGTGITRCGGCNGMGYTVYTGDGGSSGSYGSGGSSSSGSSSSSSSRGTRMCDLCDGKGNLWDYTGFVGDTRTVVYCSVSGCDVTVPHKHKTCHRCGGSGRLSL